jgi:hypothetical protein
VAKAVGRYNEVDAERHERLDRGDYQGAWVAMLAMKAIERELRKACQAYGPQPGERFRSSKDAGS